MNPIRLFLVEDQTLVRDALAQLLSMQSDFDVIGTAADGAEAQRLLQACARVATSPPHGSPLAAETPPPPDIVPFPDIVLCDIEMPNLDGLSLTQWLSAQYPRIKTVILTTFNRSGYVQRAVSAGAWGFILKEVPVDTLAEQLRAVHLGKRVFDTDLVIAGLGQLNPLTDRERQALRLVEQDLATAAIARQLCLSEGTVRNYLSECMSKLYANSRAQAARIAREKGWL